MKEINLQRLNFLVVDDNRHMRIIINNILRGFGVRNIIEAEDGSDAFREMRTTPIDIVICDWIMEPLDGLDFTRLVRTAHDSPNPYVPIILVTGYTEFQQVIQARDAGVTEILAKPVSSQGLYSRIRVSIEKPRPFVSLEHFVGPSRRRRIDPKYEGADRRLEFENGLEGQASGGKLSQEDVEKLFN